MIIKYLSGYKLGTEWLKERKIILVIFSPFDNFKLCGFGVISEIMKILQTMQLH